MGKNQYIRKEIYSIDEVLSKVELEHTKKDTILFGDDLIKMGSDRYKLFKYKGVTCVTCGLVAKFFAKERFRKNSKIISYHMNLYGIDESGNDILFTKDHIHPKKLGGVNHISNYQTMCTICNNEKGCNI